VLTALACYREGRAALFDDLTHNPTSYRAKQRSTILDELLEKNVLVETETAVELRPVDTETHPEAAAYRVTLPSKLDFSSFSPTELKVYIACHKLVRWSRTPFRFTATFRELANEAQVTDRRLGAALRVLGSRELLSAKGQWKRGTTITLLDPEYNSGAALFYLGEYHRQRLNSIPVFDRFKVLLQDYDPRGHLRNIRGPIGKYQTHCPLCKRTPSDEPSFVFDVDADHWHCFRCKRKGDSARLWARLERWIGRRDWKSMMSESCGIEVVDYEPKPGVEEPTERRIHDGTVTT
jgi:hypothetical protein